MGKMKVVCVLSTPSWEFLVACLVLLVLAEWIMSFYSLMGVSSKGVAKAGDAKWLKTFYSLMGVSRQFTCLCSVGNYKLSTPSWEFLFLENLSF